LRDGGVWDNAVKPDARSIAALLERGELENGLRARIESLITWEETSTLRLSGA